MFRRDALLRSPAALFIASRVILSIIAVAVVTILPGKMNPDRSSWDGHRLHEIGNLIDVWARWDSDWYLRIAEDWYDWPSGTPAYFPFYPTGVGVLGRLLGGHFVLAGVVTSLVAGAVAVSLLHRLVVRRFDVRTADRASLYLILFPTSVFLGAVYTESLFLALAVGTFVAGERSRFTVAGALTGLAMLTRSQGIALLPVLAWYIWRSNRRRQNAWNLVLPLAMFALYPLVLWIGIGHPLAFQEAQSRIWQRSFDVLAPLTGPVHALANGETTPALFALLMIPLAIASYALVGVPYGLYATVVLWLPLSYPSPEWWLYSFPRYCLVAFPCFIALARLTARRWLHLSISAVFATALTVFVVRWALGYWVA